MQVLRLLEWLECCERVLVAKRGNCHILEDLDGSPDCDAFAVHDDLVHVLDLILLFKQHGFCIPEHCIVPPLLDLLRLAQGLTLLPLFLHL